MAKVKKMCRICGKEYTPCSYCENDMMAFHYRTICCSKECARVYLQRVLEARGEIKNAENSSDEKPRKKRNTKKDNSEVVVSETQNSEDASIVKENQSVEKDQNSEVEEEQIEKI